MPPLDVLRIMEASRQGDRREGILLRQSKGWFAVGGMGQEPMAALAYALRPDDLLFCYYRDRALCLARGLTTYDLALEFFARADSCSGGRQMPGHHGCKRLGIVSVATPTASQCIPAAGAAWAAKLQGTDRVVACCVGDASVRQGEFYEALAFALQEKLPLVMVVEDNGYGISTPTAPHDPFRLRVLDSSSLVRIDARDPYVVLEATLDAVERARRGGGPTTLWCEMDRLCPHTSSDDQRVYRSADELAEIAHRDPIRKLVKRVVDDGLISAEDWQYEAEAIARAVEADYDRAFAAPEPDPAGLLSNTIGTGLSIPPIPGELASALVRDEPITMVEAINLTLQHALSLDPTIVMFGEDIEDPKGGVFGFTKGLSTAYPGRVRNSPLAEATIVGVGVGMAVAGCRPVFELQFIDFVGTAFNQLVNQAATLRWRTNGDEICPMVLMAPCGAYLPGGGIWHSQTNEGIWAHVPGLCTAVPSTPADAAAMLWTAIHMDDPVLFLIPKHVFRRRSRITELPEGAPGTAAVRRSGSDVTLVTWGSTVVLADEAAQRAGNEGVSVEILDLRWISPCDWPSVEASVARTGRLVVLHEDNRTGGFGETVVAQMTSHPERWDAFLAPPQIVARMDTQVPFCPSLEYAALPDLDAVMEAIRTVMG
ncbi:MAG: 2-oxoisovalerate dehydrogenase [Chthonomonadales bacterium]|nr:2-oxoisovalerate dehydrogenase [Chthonomonadales bacterium]